MSACLTRSIEPSLGESIYAYFLNLMPLFKLCFCCLKYWLRYCCPDSSLRLEFIVFFDPPFVLTRDELFVLFAEVPDIDFPRLISSPFLF